MNSEFLDFCKEYAGVIAAVLAFVADFVVALVVAFNSTIVRRALANAKKRETFTICPHCHQKVMLSEVDFRLPDGSIDNDLNGKPDVEERGK